MKNLISIKTNKVLKKENSCTHDKREYSGQSYNTHSIRYRTKEFLIVC